MTARAVISLISLAAFALTWALSSSWQMAALAILAVLTTSGALTYRRLYFDRVKRVAEIEEVIEKRWTASGLDVSFTDEWVDEHGVRWRSLDIKPLERLQPTKIRLYFLGGTMSKIVVGNRLFFGPDKDVAISDPLGSGGSFELFSEGCLEAGDSVPVSFASQQDVQVVVKRFSD